MGPLSLRRASSIFWAGGVGTTATQLAKILGASCVIGTVGSESKVQTALEMGCNQVISRDGAYFSTKVNEITSGRGVDVIVVKLDTSGFMFKFHGSRGYLNSPISSSNIRRVVGLIATPNSCFITR
ncbi:hypothetical protein D2Q93_09155 [Alicyclobacillaceae bacterium I2511]|nr:hypothetical protein D2Q93_09155 [Alicyclobacillaceae bacterium I2511]